MAGMLFWTGWKHGHALKHKHSAQVHMYNSNQNFEMRGKKRMSNQHLFDRSEKQSFKALYIFYNSNNVSSLKKRRVDLIIKIKYLF